MWDESSSQLNFKQFFILSFEKRFGQLHVAQGYSITSHNLTSAWAHGRHNSHSPNSLASSKKAKISWVVPNTKAFPSSYSVAPYVVDFGRKSVAEKWSLIAWLALGCWNWMMGRPHQKCKIDPNTNNQERDSKTFWLLAHVAIALRYKHAFKGCCIDLFQQCFSC